MFVKSIKETYETSFNTYFNFLPDGVSTAYLYNDIALRLQKRGYEVVVLTTTPHFNVVPEQVAQQPMHWKVWGFCKVSKFHRMTVLHVPQKKFKSTSLRLIGFIYQASSMALNSICSDICKNIVRRL